MPPDGAALDSVYLELSSYFPSAPSIRQVSFMISVRRILPLSGLLMISKILRLVRC